MVTRCIQGPEVVETRVEQISRLLHSGMQPAGELCSGSVTG